MLEPRFGSAAKRKNAYSAGTATVGGRAGVCRGHGRGGKGYSSPWASLSCTRSCRACSSNSRLAKPRSSLAGLDHPLAVLSTLPYEKAGLCHFAFALSPTPTKRCSLQPDEFRQGKPVNPRGLVQLNKWPVSARGLVWRLLSRSPSRRKVRAWLRPNYSFDISPEGSTGRPKAA
jgi:hypothetical protein